MSRNWHDALALPDKECYLNIPNENAVDSPLDIQKIDANQKEDAELLARKYKHSENYFEKWIGEFDIICYSNNSAEPLTKWRIALPKQMLKPTIK